MKNNPILQLFKIMLLMVVTAMTGVLKDIHAAEPIINKTQPVPVTFGIRSLSPDTPVDVRTAFVSKQVRLPDAVCNDCTVNDQWTRTWALSNMTLDNENTLREQGWFLFRSGLNGIGISVKIDPKGSLPMDGEGIQLKNDEEIEVGLVRMSQDTAAGLAQLPAADFTRTTTFIDQEGNVKYVQEDTLRVFADMRVPTCTSSAGNLTFILPDISQVFFRRNVTEGGFSDLNASDSQLVVANCSANTLNLRVRFIPDGKVTDSSYGSDTILVGRDTDGNDTGVGYLMKYDATGFGYKQQGVVHWDRNDPVVVSNNNPNDINDALTQSITLSLQAFYARPQNGLPIKPGNINAKGIYQISYE